MKNIDLDQIKERQLYKMPDAFFEELQEKVLERTVFQQESLPLTPPKTPFRRWVFAAAACFAVISGSVLISQYNEIQEPSATASHASTNIIPEKRFTVPNKLDEGKTRNLVENNSVEKSSQNPQEYVSFNNKGNHHNKASHAPNDPSLPVETQIAAKQGNITKASTTEAQIDVLLASFSPEELALLAQNIEQDVYLDLYN